MLLKRIIPCLDVHDGRVVKGTNFVDIRDAGDPVELAAHYDREGADELVFLDITASHEKRDTIVDLVRRCADQVFIPFTIGGGIRSEDDVRAVLGAGADKVSLNSAAIRDPSLITTCARRFGSQCVVVAIDAKRSSGAIDAKRSTVAIDAKRVASTPSAGLRRPTVQRRTRANSRRSAGGRPTSTAAASPPASTRWNGRPGPCPWVRGRYCSPPWTRTAPRTATTWSSTGR